MASYKRTSKNVSKNVRKTRTQSSTGSYTNSTSVKTGTGRTTYTQKSNGQSYTTVTTRMGDGSIERRRISSYASKKSRQRKESSGIGSLFLFIVIAIGVVAALFQ
jgi:cobalamin biosynthesis Mg chelatase CobN